MKKSQMDLTQGRILPTILFFAFPIMISNIFQQLYNTADTMIVGNYLGEEALAAVGASAAIFELMIGFAMGVGNGMGIVIAKHYGAKNQEMVKKSVAGALVIGVVISLSILTIGQFALRPLLSLLGTPKNIIGLSYQYIHLILLGVGITFAYNLGAALLRAIGDSLVALYFLVFSASLNIVLDLYFITQLGLGVQSAGLATIISQGLSASLCFVYIYKKVHILIPRKKDFVWDKKLYRSLLGQGLSFGLMFSIVSIGTVILQTAINSFGVLIIGAQTTARRIMGLTLMPMTAVAASCTTFVSQNLGAQKIDRIYRGVKTGAKIVMTWGLIATVLIYLFGPMMIHLISGSNEAELIANATLYQRLTTPFFPILGCLFVLRNSLQGMGNKLTPLISSLTELAGKIFFVVFIIPKVGYIGVILCEPVIWLPMTAQLYLAFKKHPLIASYRQSQKNA